MNNFPAHNDYSGVYLFNESSGSLPVTKKDVQQAVDLIQKQEQCHFKLIEVVFVNRRRIIEINKKHLNHDYSTDIITFHYGDETDFNQIEGTLYGCFSQIEEQARERNKTLKNEFLRIIIHGLLHLCGYDDKTEGDQQVMTQKENFYLDKLSFDKQM